MATKKAEKPYYLDRYGNRQDAEEVTPDPQPALPAAQTD
jgi:hypothetical protein